MFEGPKGRETIPEGRIMAKKSFDRKKIAVQRGIRFRRATLDKRIEHGRIAFPNEIISALDSANTDKTDFDRVAEILDLNDSKTRIAAAFCLEELANAWDGKCRCIEVSDTRKKLLNAITSEASDDDYAVQQHLLRCLAKCHFATADEVFPKLAEKLRCHIPEIQSAVLSAIQSYGVDRASELADEICDLVSSPVAPVQQHACELMAWLGADAVTAVPKMCQALRVRVERSERAHITLALNTIDQAGRILTSIEEPELRAILADELRRLGASGRDLRQTLSKYWGVDDKLGAEALPAFTLGQLKTLFNCSERTIRRKIEDRILPIAGKTGTAYQVDPLVVDLFIRAGGFGHKESEVDESGS